MTRLTRPVLALAAALSLWASAAHADTQPLRYQLKPYPFSTSATTGDGAGHVVEMAGAPWLRLIFQEVRLQPGVKLRLTSLKDGAQQHLDARSLKAWRNTSAYFNGSAVRVELLAPKGSKGNRLSIAQVMVGEDPPVQTESQCGSQDNRVASNAPNRARLLDVGCTANLMANGCFITAGHCMSSASLVNVVEFNVPSSSSSGSLNHPAPSDQYVPTANRQFQNGGTGKDWGVFTVSPNTETGLTPLQAQGPGLSLATTLPAVGDAVEITGYGVDSGTANQTQQVHSGPITSVVSSSTRLLYQADTEGGNSGSAVLKDGEVVAIHTHGGCSTSGSGANSGTLFTNAQFQAGFQAVCAAVTPLPTCADITQAAARCTARGKMTVGFTLADASHDGQTLTLAVDNVPFDVPIVGNVARFVGAGFAPGTHTLQLTEPANCSPVRTVRCP